MTIFVDIADRHYDFTDEEKAAEAIADFQAEHGLEDRTILSLWEQPKDPMRILLQKRIFDAVDRNGTARRAEETVPANISLSIA